MSGPRVVGLDAARRRWGSRADDIAAAYDVGDPVADAAVAAMRGDIESGRRQLIAATHGSAVHGPDSLRALVDDARQPLPWHDEGCSDHGAAVLRRLAPWAALVLRCYALPLAYASPIGNKPLVMTERLVADTDRRLTETARFVWATQDRGAMAVGAVGWRACVRVRWTHAVVRAGLRRGAWPASWGAPLPQPDLAATALLFGVKAAEGMRRLDLALSQDDVDSIAHLYRVVAARVGVGPLLHAPDYATGQDLFELLTAMHGPPDADSVRLTDALMKSPVLHADSGATRASARVVSWCMRGLGGGLLGEAAGDLGLPSGLRRTAGLRWLARRVRAPLPGQLRAIETFVLRSSSRSEPDGPTMSGPPR